MRRLRNHLQPRPRDQLLITRRRLGPRLIKLPIQKQHRQPQLPQPPRHIKILQTPRSKKLGRSPHLLINRPIANRFRALRIRWPRRAPPHKSPGILPLRLPILRIIRRPRRLMPVQHLLNLLRQLLLQLPRIPHPVPGTQQRATQSQRSNPLRPLREHISRRQRTAPTLSHQMHPSQPQLFPQRVQLLHKPLHPPQRRIRRPPTAPAPQLVVDNHPPIPAQRPQRRKPTRTPARPSVKHHQRNPPPLAHNSIPNWPPRHIHKTVPALP